MTVCNLSAFSKLRSSKNRLEGDSLGEPESADKSASPKTSISSVSPTVTNFNFFYKTKNVAKYVFVELRHSLSSAHLVLVGDDNETSDYCSVLTVLIQ